MGLWMYNQIWSPYSFTRSWDNGDWSFGDANPQSWERGGRRGSALVPFVTFSLSLRVSGILRLFHTRPLVSPKFPCVPREWVDNLWATKSEGVALIIRAISFQTTTTILLAIFYYFQPTWSWSTNVTERQTERRTGRQTTCSLNAALCIVHHAVTTSQTPISPHPLAAVYPYTAASNSAPTQNCKPQCTKNMEFVTSSHSAVSNTLHLDVV